MHAGTISALDSRDRFGLIDADDGRILLFKRADFEPPLCGMQVGARVEFMDAIAEETARAVAVRVPPQPL